MAQEIVVVLDPGLTLTARLMQGATAAVSGISLSESPVAGLYTGSVPGGTAAGAYQVLVNSGADIVATGPMQWDGSAEVLPGGGGGDSAAIAAAVWASAARTLTEAGSTVSDDIAAAVRAALAVELARIDATISSRHQAGVRINSNIVAVNGLNIMGAGTEVDPWGPV